MTKGFIARFTPAEFAATVTDADYKSMLANGISVLLFDIDSTLAGHNVPEPSDDIAVFMRSLPRMGFTVCFISNNSKERVDSFNRNLGFMAFPRAGKPSTQIVHTIAKDLGLKLSQMAIIGDQLFTDIWCGNRAGIHTVLVRPIPGNDPLQIRFKRLLECIILKKINPRNKSN